MNIPSIASDWGQKYLKSMSGTENTWSVQNSKLLIVPGELYPGRILKRKTTGQQPSLKSPACCRMNKDDREPLNSLKRNGGTKTRRWVSVLINLIFFSALATISWASTFPLNPLPICVSQCRKATYWYSFLTIFKWPIIYICFGFSTQQIRAHAKYNKYYYFDFF